MKKIEKTINEICRLTTGITDKDFEELQEMAEEQANYIHPLKLATANRIREAGEYNKKVIPVLKELRDIFIEGKPKEEK